MNAAIAVAPVIIAASANASRHHSTAAPADGAFIGSVLVVFGLLAVVMGSVWLIDYRDRKKYGW